MGFRPNRSRTDNQKKEEMKYRKKPVVIEAILLTTDNYDEVCDFIASTPAKVNERAIPTPDGGWTHTYDGVVIRTLEGTMKASVGDYIIKGVKGEIYPCKPDIFEATYDCVGTPFDRMYREIDELVERFNKLDVFMKTDKFLALPPDVVGLLEIQYGAMLAYNHALQLCAAKMKETQNQ